MTTSAPSGAPPYARQVWADHSNLYLEIPSTNPAEAPYIMKFGKTPSGLSAALNVVSSAFIASQPAPGYSPFPSRQPSKPGINDFTAKQREAAHEVLKKLGLI